MVKGLCLSNEATHTHTYKHTVKHLGRGVGHTERLVVADVGRECGESLVHGSRQIVKLGCCVFSSVCERTLRARQTDTETETDRQGHANTLAETERQTEA